MPEINIFDFVVFIIPGFLAIEIFRTNYPVKERSDFKGFGWSLICSVVIVVTTRWVDHRFGLNLFGAGESISNSRLVLSLILGGVLLGILLSLVEYFRFRLPRKYGWFKFLEADSQTIWAKINAIKNDDWAVVYVNDGSIYLGYIKHYSSNPNCLIQDFLLSEAKRVDDKLNEIYPISGQGIYLTTDKLIKIEYVRGT